MTWRLDPAVTFLNHGSFGAAPDAVLDHQAQLRDRMERQPVRFFQRDLEGLLATAVTAVADFVGADGEGLVPVANATTGVNAVLRSLTLRPGDRLVTTDHAYPACANALRWVAERWGAEVVVVPVPFPPPPPDRIVAEIASVLDERVRLLLIDHVTSPTGLILPVAEVVAAAAARGIDVLVDGAHAPGMVPVDIGQLGAAYYTGNCHKWMCAPKGAGFLWVRPDRRDQVVPTVISHGPGRGSPGRSSFRALFDWVGTDDPTAFLAVPFAVEHVVALGGGWPAVMRANHALAVEAAGLVADAVSGDWAGPDVMGSMASVTLPGVAPGAAPGLQDRLLFEHSIEVPVIPWPQAGHSLLRLSAQLYNTIDDYERLAGVLAA